jgi:Single cache domain 3
MFPRWWRLGIRPQLTMIVILGAVLSTVATLFIADNAINNYVLEQASTQEHDNMKIAKLVLKTQYGDNISISSDNKLVADLPGSGKDFNLGQNANFGKYVLNDSIDYVDYVGQLIGNSVSLYQCADSHGSFTQCVRISTTYKNGNGSSAVRATGAVLTPTLNANMDLAGTPHDWLGKDTIGGRDYFTDYSPIFNPQQQLIGVLYVGVPLDQVTGVVQQTTIELVLIGTIIMVAGIVLAIFFASAIVGTLQRAARQVNGASERIGSIAAQQSSGSAQQVWAINAINQALQNFSETAKDISHRTDQLALMGNQVLQRRQEISPTQIDSILAYITRSVRDISVASKQQASQYERMTGAMQAVIEIAEQVAGNSQQASESSERLELVVRQLQQLVGVRMRVRSTTSEDMGLEAGDATVAAAPQGRMQGTVRAVRPAGRGGMMQQAPGTGGLRYGGAMQMGNAGAAINSGQLAGPRMQQGQQRGMMGQGMMAQGGDNGMSGPLYGAPAANGAGRPGARPMGPSFQGGPPMAGYEMRGSGGLPPMGPPPGGGYDFTGGQEWRLPPMPEMPPLPNFDTGQMPPPPRTNGSQYGGISRAGASSGGRGMNAPGQGFSGPNSMPGMSGPNGDGWPPYGGS